MTLFDRSIVLKKDKLKHLLSFLPCMAAGMAAVTYDLPRKNNLQGTSKLVLSQQQYTLPIHQEVSLHHYHLPMHHL